MSVRRHASGGVHYNYFRDYDPAVGRYVQSDPIGLLGSALSTFAYAYDDPLKFVDPSGLRPPGGAIDFRNFMRDHFFGGRFPDKDLRSDWKPWGWGCGDQIWDKYVPDIFFQSCRQHDKCYDDQCGREFCDRQFLDSARREGGGSILPGIYYFFLSAGGGPAYDRAGREQREAQPPGAGP